jgi:hypothetical protein
MNRISLAAFLGLGLAVAVVLALVVSPFASSQPDGLERVAIDHGFAGQARGHAMADGPLADYAVTGVDGARLSTGLAGVIGVVVCFVIGAGVVLAVRRSSRRAA